MSPNTDSPVRTQMTVSVLNRALSSEYHGMMKSDGSPVARRRVFVQTDTGSVFGIELDRGDNVHTVKRRLQLALNVPTDESSLTFGDLVLKNDLSGIRNDSPLLLTRNLLHRSSSTPCLSPNGKDLQQRDMSGPIEILGCSSRCPRTKQLIKDAVKAIESGVDPIPVPSGLGGAYYFRNEKGQNVAIVKPTDEEPFAPNNPKGFIGKALGQPGLKKSVRVGETGFREVAAYLLDYNCFANVPPTVLVKITHSIFNLNEGVGGNNKVHETKPAISKIASFQKFIPHDFDASDHGTSSFPVAAVHRIGILDVRIFNTDRHAGNLLVRKVESGPGRFGGRVELIPIDHGLCLPETLEDPYFEWIHWPQASIPFSEDELKYIADLDATRDSEMLRMELPMIREACLRVLILSTIFLKEVAGYGLCLAEIGEMMTRESRGIDEEPSDLELVCIEARRWAAETEFSPETEWGGNDEFQFEIDCDEVSPSHHFGFRGGSSRNPFSKLESSRNPFSKLESSRNLFSKLESLEEEDERPPSFPEISASLKNPGFQSRALRREGSIDNSNKNRSCQRTSANEQLPPSAGFVKLTDMGADEWNKNRSCQRTSANEQLPPSAGFVKLTDMGADEWRVFLEKFQDLLRGVLRGRKQGGAWQRLRLGTSCQF